MTTLNLVMAGLEAATQRASVRERKKLSGALTCAGWMAASGAAMAKWEGG